MAFNKTHLSITIIMYNVGILMSIYNETLYEIERAMKSMLNQTYKDFVFVIVLDNPSREDVKEFLSDFQKKDNRIRLIFNEENIGLALSLNKARNLIETKYLCRMDADDYSFPNRIERQLDAFNNYDVDFVFSQYYSVDEDGKILDEENDYYDTSDINRLLNIINVIHHPTVMMTTSIFDKVSGYRNFPCAQDYDLWLRLSEVGCRFYMIDEKLIKYTIRDTSVGNSKAFKQIATLNYIKQLRNMRLKQGSDDFSVENLNEYYQKNKVLDGQEASLKVRKELKKAQDYISERKMINALIIKMSIFIKYKVYRRHFINKILDKYRFKNH